MHDRDRRVPRRDVLYRSAALAAIAASGATLVPAGARAEAARLDPASADAKRLGYAHDADATERPSPQQHCSTCTHFTPVGDGPWGECKVFRGRLVNADGWCSAFYARG